MGTEQGSLLLCNRKAKTAADRVGAAYPGDAPDQARGPPHPSHVLVTPTYNSTPHKVFLSLCRSRGGPLRSLALTNV